MLPIVLVLLQMRSLLTQESGLKLNPPRWLGFSIPVSPYTGEWIEIAWWWWCCYNSCVSPYTGEWIEILYHFNYLAIFLVSPYTGEWIEIEQGQSVVVASESLLTQESGLKFHYK